MGVTLEHLIRALGILLPKEDLCGQRDGGGNHILQKDTGYSSRSQHVWGTFCACLMFNLLSRPARLTSPSHITDGETEALRGKATLSAAVASGLSPRASPTASALSTLRHCVPGMPPPRPPARGLQSQVCRGSNPHSLCNPLASCATLAK